MAKRPSGFEKTAKATKRDDLFSNGFSIEPETEEEESEENKKESDEQSDSNQ